MPRRIFMIIEQREETKLSTTWLDFSHWMTASECADWWSGLLQKQVDSTCYALDKKGLGANTPVGFCICWGGNSVHSAVDLLLLDPLRLGQGTGLAAGGGSKLGVLTDIARGLAFLPLGKLIKLGAAVRAPAAAGAVAQSVRLQIDGTARALLNKLGNMWRVPDPGGEICWAVQLVRAVQNGGKYMITLEDLDRIVCGDGASVMQRLASRGVWSVRELLWMLRSLHAEYYTVAVADVKAISVEVKLEEAWKQLSRVCSGRNGWMLFGVTWEHGGHLMLARVSNGALEIYDRTQKVVRSLKALEDAVPGYRGISSARFVDGDCFAFLPDSAVVPKPGSLGILASQFTAGSLLGPLAVPIKVIPSMLMHQ